jgi:predicted transcriptional regulator
VVRHLLRRLLKKGKIGTSHTHEDNVYRGVADHDKGLAKQAVEVLRREGYLVLKAVGAESHVSLSPALTNEIRAIVAGDVTNHRLARYFEDEEAR